ncbi:hypothetical protein [Acidithiobacillus sp.]
MNSEPLPSAERILAPYAGMRVILLTKHGKEKVITPALKSRVGCLVEQMQGYDTDALGTFTREIPRPDTQLATVRKKVKKKTLIRSFTNKSVRRPTDAMVAGEYPAASCGDFYLEISVACSSFVTAERHRNRWHLFTGLHA